MQFYGGNFNYCSFENFQVIHDDNFIKKQKTNLDRENRQTV